MVFFLPSYERRIREVCGKVQRLAPRHGPGGVEIKIRNQRPAIISASGICPWRQRSMAALVHAAQAACGLPDMRLYISVDDLHADTPATSGISFSFSYRPDLPIIPVPCFGFDKWVDAGVDSYAEFHTRMRAAAQARPWEGRDPRLFWAGAVGQHPFRARFYDAWHADTRRFDLTSVKWGNSSPHKRPEEPNPCEGFRPLYDVCGYQRALDIQGWGYSARVKYLLLSGAALVYVERDYVNEFYMGELVPEEHYVAFPKAHLHDVDRLFAPERSERMADMARRAFETASVLLEPDNILYNLSDGLKLVKRLTNA